MPEEASARMEEYAHVSVFKSSETVDGHAIQVRATPLQQNDEAFNGSLKFVAWAGMWLWSLFRHLHHVTGIIIWYCQEGK
jgi:hypothetical protein